jgi:RHS repeat-associated protein
VQVVDERSSNTTNTYSGTATVLNQSSSAFGDGWTLDGLEQIISSGTSGVILSLGASGQSLWFAGNPGVGSNYTTPTGDFSTLTKTSGGYTRTLPDGTQILFNSSGYQTAMIDLNNNHTTYSYNGSNQLTSVEDQYGNFTTFTYSSGDLSTIKDPAGRLTTFTFSGSDLESVEQADGSFVTYSYNGSGQMTVVQDQRGYLTSIAYDSAARVGTISLPEGATQLFSSYQEQGWTNSGTSGSPAAATLQAESVTNYTDPNGNSAQIRPDWTGLGQLSESTDPYGNVSANDDSTSNGLPYVSIDPLSRITQTVYDSQGSPVTIAYPDLTEDQFTYNSDDEPLTHTDGNSHTTSYTYDSHGNLTGVQDPVHNLTTMTYTSTGRVQTVTNSNDYTTTYLYDSQDRQTTVQFPNSTTNLYGYDSQGDVTKFTDGRGNATTYSFDALNRQTGETDALNDITTITMDSAGNITKVQAPTPAGQTARTTTYAYDSMERLTTVTDALGYQTVYGRDNDGNVVTITDKMGRVTTIQYDQMDRPVVTIDPMSNAVTATYDADGEKLTLADALNRTTSYSYSVRGWLAQVTDPMGYLITYTYSATGKNLDAYQGNLTQFLVDGNTYNADDELIAQENGVSETTSYSYDGVGNLTTVEDPNTNVVSYVYNSVNELTEVIQPAGVTVSYTYDNSGNQQTTTDALGHTTTVQYDALDRATTIISAVSGTTTITYDSAGRETSLTDPVGNKTQWAYDSDDRLTTTTQPNNATFTYVYDKDRELTDTTDADGRRTTYSFNADGDQTGETWVGASPSEKITYTYDADNEMTGAADAFATLTKSYDKDGRLGTMVTSGPGTGQPTVTLTYSYDQLNDETSVKDSLSSQGITTYTFNDDRQMTNISTSYGGTASPLITFTYDNGGRLTNISRTGPGSSDQVNTTITYDSANRVTTITDGLYSWQGIGYGNTPLATFTYAYDSASRVTTMVSTDPSGTDTYTYTYDNANELTGADKNGTQTESYAYDANGNRTGTGYSTTVMNETAASPGPVTYTYDGAGNMITSKSGSTTTTYTYDFRNRLTEVTTGGTVVATYTYNALDQRIGVGDSSTQTWTVYDGKSPDANPYDDFNSSGNLTVRYLFGASVVNGAVVSGILARTTSGGTTNWYFTDKLDSVREIVNTSGTVQDQMVYDSFGNIVTETNATNGDRFKFGMQYDATIGQYYDHARWYGAGTGRFSATDPLGFRAGGINLYQYARNRPTDAVDPSGLISWSDYWYFLINPIQMDPDLYKIHQGAMTTLEIEAAIACTGASVAVGAAEMGLCTGTALAMGATAVEITTAGAVAGLAYSVFSGGDLRQGALEGVQTGSVLAGMVTMAQSLWLSTIRNMGLSDSICFVAGTQVLVPNDSTGSSDDDAAPTPAAFSTCGLIAAAVALAGALPIVTQRDSNNRRPSRFELADAEADSDAVRGQRATRRRRPDITPTIGAPVTIEIPRIEAEMCGRGAHAPSGELASRDRASPVCDGRRRLALATAVMAWALLVSILAQPAENERHTAHTVPATRPYRVPSYKPIETIRVGERVLTAQDPVHGAARQPSSVDPRTWRLLRLRADVPWSDGTTDVIEVETLQPSAWVIENRAEPGSLVRLPLDLEEMGVPPSILARVVWTGPCPTLDGGPGRRVLTTVSHLNKDLWEIKVASKDGRGYSIRPTGLHKFYSVSRRAWVSAKSLVRGERLDGLFGEAVVITAAPVPGAHRVYNMNVDGEHVFRVAAPGLLVHNNGCNVPRPPAISMDDALDQAQAHLGPGNAIAEPTGKGTNLQFRMPSVDSAGNVVQKMARFDLNPNDPHVAQNGPHLNLETQVNGKPVGTDPHLAVDPSTIRPGDYLQPGNLP